MYALHFTKLKARVWQATYNNLPVNYENTQRAYWALDQLEELGIKGQLESWDRNLKKFISSSGFNKGLLTSHYTIVVYLDTPADEAEFIMKASNGVYIKHYFEI